MKAKKVLAVLMASAMIMGTSVTAFAAPGTTPVETDNASVAVSDVEVGATVTAYQIVDAVYNEHGFVGYDVVKDTDGTPLVTIADPEKPTSEEVATIAKNINNGSVTLTSKTMTYSGETEDYEADLEAGYWIVLVRDTSSAYIYNPMMVGVYYSVGGNDNTLVGDSVSATEDWTLATENAWAKRSEISFTKEADKETADLGDEVNYTITAQVPAYGPEYEDVEFTVSDALNGLLLKGGTVQVNGQDIDEIADVSDDISYVGTEDATGANASGFTIEFDSDWIKKNCLGDNVVITYTAIMTDATKVNKDSHDNNAGLVYSNSPKTTASKNDVEKVYTFDVDGDVTGNVLKKVGDDGRTPLANAKFTLYTDQELNNQYVNTEHPSGEATAITDAQGKIHIVGLEAGTYYLKETEAPTNYTLNDTVYKIEIVPVINNEELTSWQIKVTDMKKNTDATNAFTISGGTVTATEENVTSIQNTKISSLPSTGGIGTTIFTIGGCAIMVTAAGLYFATRKKTEK